MRYLADSNGYTHIFSDGKANGIVGDVVSTSTDTQNIIYWTYNYFRFGAAILISGCRSMSDNVANDTIGLAITENVGVAVGISEISHTIEKL